MGSGISNFQSTKGGSLVDLKDAPEPIKLAVSCFQDKWRYACGVTEIDALFHGGTTVNNANFLRTLSDADSFKLKELGPRSRLLTIYHFDRAVANVVIDKDPDNSHWAIGDIFFGEHLKKIVECNFGDDVYRQIAAIFTAMKIYVPKSLDADRLTPCETEVNTKGQSEQTAEQQIYLKGTEEVTNNNKNDEWVCYEEEIHVDMALGQAGHMYISK